MENAENVKSLYKITGENVFMLPFAFNKSGSGQMVVNQPSDDFSDKIEPLRKKIFNWALNSNPQETSSFTL